MSNTVIPKKKQGFWKRLGYYAEVYFCFFMAASSFLIMITSVGKDWTAIGENPLVMVYNGGLIAFNLTWWICLWNTGKGSFKKLLEG